MLPKQMRILREDKEIDGDHAECILPEELVIENILTRLPGRTLAQWSCISKLWYNLIFNDSRFAKTHIHIANNKNNKLNLIIALHNVWGRRYRNSCYFSLDNDYKPEFLTGVNMPVANAIEPVGYCNGLACATGVRKSANDSRLMLVMNPGRRETLSLPYIYPSNGECDYLCHGFGFDSLSDEYKVVIIFTSKDNKEFITMVFILGTKSWKSIVASVAEISPPPGCSPFPSRMLTKVWQNIRTPATLCGRDLYWRIINREVEDDDIMINNNHHEVIYNNNIGMLLSFDIHKEKIQFIRLPTECNLIPSPKTTTINRVVEHHLLEHKGYPCVALCEKAMGNDIYRGRPCCNAQTSFCRCRVTVQLYILKDKEKQVWIKGDNFGVQVKELGLLPGPFCCYFDTTTLTTASFPTRLLSVSDQLLLYSFDGKCLKLYNFHTKHLEVVRLSSSSDLYCRRIFEAKMKGSRPSNVIGYDDDDMYCPYLDYQLHAQVENIHSLKAFIPAGETRTFDQEEDYLQFRRSNDLPAGWLHTVPSGTSDDRY